MSARRVIAFWSTAQGLKAEVVFTDPEPMLTRPHARGANRALRQRPPPRPQRHALPSRTSHQVTLRDAGASDARRTAASEVPEDGPSRSNTPSCLSSVIPNRCVERPRRSL